MLNRSTTWAAAFLAATFGAGVVVGVGGRALWVRYASAAAPERAHGVERLMGELNGELRLTALQRDSVHAILQRHYTRMSEAWETVRPRFDTLRAAMDSEVSHRGRTDRKSTRLNSSHSQISYAVFCLKKKK